MAGVSAREQGKLSSSNNGAVKYPKPEMEFLHHPTLARVDSSSDRTRGPVGQLGAGGGGKNGKLLKIKFSTMMVPSGYLGTAVPQAVPAKHPQAARARTSEAADKPGVT
eukprot:SAG31_NODE_1052_length_10154_cov_2.814818_12_plen_108_part_01